MLPARLLNDKFWLLLAILVLVVGWSLPVVAQSLYAENRVVFSLAFALAWSGLMTGFGLLLYAAARENSPLASLLMVLALTTLCLLYRAPAQFVEPQFTDEDGCIFYVQQREMGWHALLVPYNGYYHTLIRLVAAVMAHVPTLFVPSFYNLSWLGIYSLVVAYILWQYPDRKLAPLIALTTVLVSHTCEVFLVMTDTIWVVGLGLTAFVLLPVPEIKRWPCYFLVGILFLFALTGPFSLILTPFYFLRWLMNRKSFPLIYFSAVTLGALIQLTALHGYYSDKHPGLPLTFSTFLFCLKVAVVRLPWSLAVGYQPDDPYWLIGLVAVVILFGFIGREIVTDIRKQFFTLSCLVLCAVYVTMTLLRVTPIDVLLPIVNGDRYFYIPKILLVWALIHLAVTARNPKPFYIALFFCAMGSMVQFPGSQVVVDNHWARYAALIDEGKFVVVPVNPPGWNVIIKGTDAAPTPK